MFKEYDVIVVGGGHAGCEAAAAAANMGCSVLLATMNMQTIAQMSCNPAMGGVAKGQIVREIDALGGYSGIVTDKTMVQFRMLNRSKGPAMWSPRAQSDRLLFATEWRYILEGFPGIDFWQEMVTGLLVNNGRIRGVRTGMGMQIPAKTVVLTNGTFLNGIIHIGEKQFGGGRVGEKAARGITEQLKELGFHSGRMKTGTPPRIDGRSINYALLEEQKGDEKPGRFSFMPTPLPGKQLSCHIAYTSKEVHEALREGFDQSPMFTGRIQGSGPRYCPSIEDKIDRFAQRDRHQLFVEPEGWRTIEVYLNGFSTSLPEDVQFKALRKIKGFEQARMFRPGYAIEYDYFPPTQLDLSLETKRIKGLFFAGQINGTTGYEEAACQGMLAGINAVRAIRQEKALVLKRSEAYIGVLIDDLINKGTEEPYRMFTSRAEYRLMLRQDNADLRLTPLGYQIGTVSEERMQRAEEKKTAVETILSFFENQSIKMEEANPILEEIGSAPIKQGVKLKSILSRPRVNVAAIRGRIKSVTSFLNAFEEEAIEEAEIMLKYEGYLEKEREMAEKMNRLEQVNIQPAFDYHQLPSLSSEAREKLSQVKPKTLGQASRISGVTPADISVLLVYLGR